MAYTVTKLITNAYYLSGIVSRQFQTVSGGQLADGLDLLNDLLAEKTTDKGMIPYYSSVTQNTVAGQEVYNIPDLISVSSVTFTLNDVRYAMNQVGRDAYFGGARANNVQSLPYNFHVERTLGGANLYVYYLPDQVYPLEIWGLFRLASVALNQDLELTTERFYISYLRFALAKRLCIEFTYDVPPELEKQLNELELQIDKISAPLDLSLQKKSTLGGRSSSPNYAIANFGGWTTNG